LFRLKKRACGFGVPGGRFVRAFLELSWATLAHFGIILAYTT
jgi:hypothetical protein